MNRFLAILEKERKLFFRQPWFWGGLAVYGLLTLYAVKLGDHEIEARRQAIDRLKAGAAQDLKEVQSKMADTTNNRGHEAAKLTSKAFMINFKLPQTTVKPPAPLAALSSGVSSFHPWHREVRYTKSYQEQTEAPLFNPLLLFTGHLDLSFVLVYLLPLLVIMLSYGVYSAEKEAGTESILSIHAQNLDFVIRSKLIFRFVVTGFLVALLNLTAFGFIPVGSPFPWTLLIIWNSLAAVYLLFWFSISYLVVSLRQTAQVSLLILTSCWLLLLIGLPATLNGLVRLYYPFPLRDEIASYRRHQGEVIWNMPPKILTDTFNRAFPDYLASANRSRDTLALSDRSVAGYYHLLDQQMTKILQPYQADVNRHNTVSYRLVRWLPGYLLEDSFTRMAENDLYSYLRFEEQTELFQKTWQKFLYPFHFNDRSLNLADLNRMPVFRYTPMPIHFPVKRISYLLALAAGIYMLGRAIVKN